MDNGTNVLEFDRQLKLKTERIEEIIRKQLPKEEGLQARVIEAMNYSLTAGGKRLRPMLMWETYRMCGGEDGSVIEYFMAAIEMIHTYSLVHDDLPAMDNDEYRRGRKTTWYVYGDAMGILAGDGLLNYAFETAVRAFCCLEDGEKDFCGSDTQKLLMARRISEALAVLARKAGIYGMIGGQAVDIMASGQAADSEQITNGAPAEASRQLLFIHEHKTAALIQAAMMIGAILAGASREQVAALEKCAYNVGIAFQIQDDILDVEGDSEELGKPIGSDAQNNKQTYVTLKGLAQSKEDVAALSKEAVSILDGFEGEHDFLKQLILALIHRRK